MATIRRFSSVQTYAQTEYNSIGILSETTWTLLDKLTAQDGDPAISSAITGIPAPVTVVANPKVATQPVAPNPVTTDPIGKGCICETTRCECGLGYLNNTQHCWVNYCPRCGRTGSLQLSWKSGTDNYHQQITCGGPPGNSCGADYCTVHGYELSGGRRESWKLQQCQGR